MTTQLSRYRAIPAAALLAFATSALLTRADVTVYDTFGPGNTYSLATQYLISGGSVLYGTYWPYDSLAVPFTPSAEGTLSRLTFATNPYGAVNTMVVTLMADSGGMPNGAVLDTITNTFQAGVMTLNSISHPMLHTGTTYWVAVAAAAGSGGVWDGNGQGLPASLMAHNGGSGWASIVLVFPAVKVEVVQDSLVVSTAADENDGSSNPGIGTGTSLREALAYAATLAGTQTITFASALAGQTITLTNGWSGPSDSSALVVTNAVVLDGLTNSPGVTLAVGAGVVKRHLHVGGTGSLTLQNLTFTGGHAPDRGGAVENADTGSITIRGCTFHGNVANWEGGAVHSWSASSLMTVDNSTFVGNTASNHGGALVSGASQTVFRCLTVVSNSCPTGPCWIFKISATLRDSIVAGNTPDGIETLAPGTLYGSSSNNLLGTGSGGGLTNGVNGNQVGVAAASLKVSALAGNGGPTMTCALQPGSPALNAGGGSGALPTDQRGNLRPFSGSRTSGPMSRRPLMRARSCSAPGGPCGISACRRTGTI